MKVNNKLVGSLIVILLLFLSLVPTSLSEENDYPWWNDDWSYRQMINIPIDTSDKDAVYQPIDLFFEFENSCWAEDDTKHSVRVIYQYGGRFKELESQIYNLKYTDDNHISSSGLVFLIPENANGEEIYYVYYNDKETAVTNYPDRVSVEDSYFSYEPIRGILTETWTYNLMQGENIIYSVAKEGHVTGDKVCQQVVKMKDGAKCLLPNMGDHTLSYSFVYYFYKNNEWSVANTADKLVTSEISIDGNLMVKIGIISESEEGLLRSTVFHKYYYCPTDEKSLYSNVKHEVLGKTPYAEDVEVFFINIISGVIKSSLIKELDYGQMPKYMHFYSDEERIETQEFDPYPESPWEKIIEEEDDYDFGSFPWVSVDDGETGMAHGVILDSINVVSSGEDERDGVQMLLYQSNTPNYPGLDGRTSYLYMGRNSYEPDMPKDNVIPEDYVIEFKSLYHSTKNGGYKEIEKQASLYQSLIAYQPTEEEKIVGEEKTEEYNLTVYTHIPPNLLMKKIGANFLLKNSYFHVELLCDDSVVGFEPSGKVSLTGEYKIDWKNASFFRKAVFSHQKPRKYIVKVYLIDPIVGDEKEFIGFDIVDLNEDTEIHINCRPQAKINLLFTDQNKDGIKNIETFVLKDDNIIYSESSSSDGSTIIGLPVSFNQKYILKSFYKGFLLNDEEISLNLLNKMFPLKKTFDVDVYDFKVEIDDSYGKIPDFDVQTSLTSDEMQDAVIIKPDRTENGVYYFDNLIPANYNLTIEYDSFKVTENVDIPETDSLLIKLYDLSVSLKDLWGFSPENNESLVFIKSFDFDNPVTIYAEKLSAGEYQFSDLYPGEYTLLINYRSTVLKHNISIPILDNKIDLVFPVTFNITTNVFDTHGNSLSDAKVIVIKDNKEISGFTANNGSLVFAVPPGEYVVKIFYSQELVAQRKVDVLNDKTLTIVTSKEPWTPYIVTAVGIIALIAAVVYSCKNKNWLLFLKFLSIILVFISLVAPWWSINGTSTAPNLETWTNVYIAPNNMVTLTTNTDVIAGNIAITEEMFTLVVDIILYISIISVALVIVNVLLKRFTNFKKLSAFALFLAMVLMIISTVVFYFASSMLSEAIVGSLFGSGKVNVVVYGEKVFEQLNCNWGLNIGFYCFISSTVLLISIFLYKIKNKFLKETRFIFKSKNYK